jgi:hypothetical protein
MVATGGRALQPGCRTEAKNMSTTTELWRMSASELADTISAKRASSEEVIEAHLRRIEDVNPTINAVAITLGEEAVDAAKSADRAVAAGGELPRLHGVPFTVKGNIDVAGTPTTQGLKALMDAYPSRDAPTSPGSGPLERSRSAGRTSPPSGFVGTPRANCGARRSIPGTGRARLARPVAATPLRWRQA